MSYKRVLLTRWSRRDRLAVLIIAVAVAFLVGTTLLLTAAGTQTTQLAGEYQTGQVVKGYNNVASAREATGPDAIVLPFAQVTDGSGQERLVITRPPPESSLPVATEGTGVSLGDLTQPDKRTLTPARADGTPVMVNVVPSQRTVVPDRWYVAPASTVKRLGIAGALVVTPTETPTPQGGVPLQSALAFFLFGTRETLLTLGAVVAASGLLIGVVVFSITRMTVRDRAKTIQIIRATGASRGTVVRVFALRAGILGVVGTALGYALGVIGVNAAVNTAVFLGLPTTLDVTVSSDALEIILPIAGSVVGVSILSGTGATWPVIRGSVLGEQTLQAAESRLQGKLPSILKPEILDLRALIPTAATLTVFIIFVILVAGMAGVVAPLTTSTDATIAEPGSPHPVASTVPEAYTTALRQDGIAASGEILTFAVRDGQPYTVRGVNYTAFQSVSDVELIAGRQPRGPTEAIIGSDLRQTLDVHINDTILLGGLTSDKIDQVRVVGVIRGEGLTDDQLLVSLTVARHLTGKPQGTVQFIRADRLPDRGIRPSVRVTRLDAPSIVTPNSNVTVTATVQNSRTREVSQRFSIQFGQQTKTRQITIPPGKSRTISVQFSAPSAGQYRLSAGGIQQTIEVAPRDGLRFGSLPSVAPPNATLLVTVQTPYGDPVANATLTTGTSQTTTGKDGTGRITVGTAGTTTIRASTNQTERRTTITVRPNATRQLIGSVTVQPSTPNVLTAPTAQVTLTNPWGTTLTRTIRITAPGVSDQQQITLAPGETVRLSVPLSRQPPGSYTVAVRTNETRLATQNVQVTGDDRIATILATGGRTGQTGIGRAIETVFGNLQIILVVITGFAGLMTVGGTTAVFAQAVHARRHTLGVYRATGASPARVSRLILTDSLRIAVCAAGIALGGATASLWGMAQLGLTTVYGVRILAIPPAWLIGLILFGAIGNTVLGAGVIVVQFALGRPLELLTSRDTGSETNKRPNQP